MKNELLGRRVKELRGKNGFSQEFLAEECKVSLRTIQRIENGITIPHGYTLSPQMGTCKIRFRMVEKAR